MSDLTHAEGLYIRGHSDDHVVIQGNGFSEQLDTSHALRFVIGRTEAGPGEFPEGVMVGFDFAPDPHGSPTWVATIGLLDEECEIPWLVEVRAKLTGVRRSHVGDIDSPTVVVHCPKGTPWRVEDRRHAGDPWQHVMTVDADGGVTKGGR